MKIHLDPYCIPCRFTIEDSVKFSRPHHGTVDSRYKKHPRDRPEVSYDERFLISRLIFPYKFLRDRSTVSYIGRFLITGVSYNESSLYNDRIIIKDLRQVITMPGVYES